MALIVREMPPQVQVGALAKRVRPLYCKVDGHRETPMLHPAPPPPPPPPATVVRFTVARRMTPPTHGVRARFRLSVERPSLAAAVVSADGFLAHAKRLARSGHLAFRLRSYRSFRREIYAPGPHAPPPRTVYVVAARFDLRGPTAGAAAPLVGRLARRAFLLSFQNVPALDQAAREKLGRRLERRVLARVRRDAVRDCRLLGDHGALVHRLTLNRSFPPPLPPRPIFAQALAARVSPPPVATARARLTVRASVSVWCSRAPPPGS